jgi:hypothetical protein
MTFKTRILDLSQTSPELNQSKKHKLVLVGAHQGWLQHECFGMHMMTWSILVTITLGVLQISSLTKRKSFECNQENIEVLEEYIKYYIVVSQRSKVWVDWIFRLWLCGMQGWEKKHFGHLSTNGKITCFLIIKEVK